MDIRILQADFEDLEKILSIQKEAFLEQARIYDDFNMPPMVETLENLKEAYHNQIILKAVIGDEIVGSVRGYLKNDLCYIGRLIVSPNHQNKGIGKALMQAIEQHFPDVLCYELFTGHKSDKNICLYEKLGYSIYEEKELGPDYRLVYMKKEKL